MISVELHSSLTKEALLSGSLLGCKQPNRLAIQEGGGLLEGCWGLPIKLITVGMEDTWPHGDCQKSGTQGCEQGQGLSEP